MSQKWNLSQVELEIVGKYVKVTEKEGFRIGKLDIVGGNVQAERVQLCWKVNSGQHGHAWADGCLFVTDILNVRNVFVGSEYFLTMQTQKKMQFFKSFVYCHF